MSLGMWGFAVALMVAICAVLAATGFKGRVTIVGIDLGTTFSVIGVNENGVVRIIKDQSGNYLVPSMVSFLDSGKVVVGREALRNLGNDSHVTIYEAKRFIGRHYDDETELARENASRPYKIVQMDSSPYSVWFDTSKLQNHLPHYSPQEIGTYVVKELLKMASLDLGHNQIRQAVIAVPAKFDHSQRAATVAAFKNAGLKVARVLEEPTAAALAYGLQNRPDVHYVVVYDFGGGTLDVSLLYISHGNVEVISMDGDNTLGGGDFDRIVAGLAIDKLKDTIIKEQLSTVSIPLYCSFPEPMCALNSLREESERVKQDLSFNLESTLRCRSLKRGENADQCKNWMISEVTITRDEMENGGEHLFKRALAAVDRLLEHSDHTAEEVDEVVMVGGSTRIPKIREDLKLKLKRSHLNTQIDPDITVAYGTATVAH